MSRHFPSSLLPKILAVKLKNIYIIKLNVNKKNSHGIRYKMFEVLNSLFWKQSTSLPKKDFWFFINVFSKVPEVKTIFQYWDYEKYH